MHLKFNLIFSYVGIFYPNKFYYLESFARFIIILKVHFYHESPNKHG